MMWRGVGVLFLLVAIAPLVHAATTGTTADFTITTNGPQRPVSVDAGEKYTVDFDVVPGDLTSSARQMVFLNFDANTNLPGCENVGGMGYLPSDHRVTLITKTYPCSETSPDPNDAQQRTPCPDGNPLLTCHYRTFDEDPKSWNPTTGQSYHVNVVIDMTTLTQTYTITGGPSRTATIHPYTREALSQGITALFGYGGSPTAGEAGANNWQIKNVQVKSEGTAPAYDPNTVSGETCTTPTGTGTPTASWSGSYTVPPATGSTEQTYGFSGASGTYAKLTSSVTLVFGGSTTSSTHQGLFHIITGPPLWIRGGVRVEQNKVVLFTGPTNSDDSSPSQWENTQIALTPGQTYTFDYTYDASSDETSVTVKDASGATLGSRTTLPTIPGANGLLPANLKFELAPSYSIHPAIAGTEFKSFQAQLETGGQVCDGGSSAPTCTTPTGTGTPTLSGPSLPYTVTIADGDSERTYKYTGATGTYARATASINMAFEGNTQNKHQGIFRFVKRPNFKSIGGVRVENNEVILATGPTPDHPNGPSQWERNGISLTPGQSYTFDYTYDASTVQTSVTVKRADGSTIGTITAPALPDYLLPGADLEIEIGPSYDSHALVGSTYTSVTGQLEAGGQICTEGSTSDGSSGTLKLKDGSGFTPDENAEGEPIELVRKDGTFFIQPWDAAAGRGVKCSESSASCAAEFWLEIPKDEDALEKFTVGFDFKVDDLQTEGHYQLLARLQNTCSNQRYWRTKLKMQGAGTPGMTTLDARAYDAHDTWMKGDYAWQENTWYRYEITYDIRDQEAYIQLYDQGGSLLQTVGGKLNTFENNLVKIEHTKDGMRVIFGFYRSLPSRITGQPHLWEFANAVVTGVPFGGDPIGGPGGSDLSTDAGNLAFLAAHMLQIENDEYSMECGPAEEVLNMPPEESTPYYCAHQHGDQIIFGTFGDMSDDNATTPESSILASLKNPLYALQIDENDINEDACNGIDTTLIKFQKCENAIKNMHTYAFVDLNSSMSFVIVSKQTVSAFDGGIMNAIVEFFKNLFGIGGDDESIIGEELSVRRFHHGYFSQKEDRDIIASWYDTSATFAYGGFITNFNVTRPPGAAYATSSGKQVLLMEMDADSPRDVKTWRRLTSALRLADVEGEVIGGGYCGDGEVGIDEECEPGGSVGTCLELYPELFTEGAVSCYPAGHDQECQVSTESCLGWERTGECWDTWEAGPSPDPCPGDPACAAGGSSGSSHGSGGTCGDGFCNEDAGESCGSCIADCGGTCPAGTSCPTEWRLFKDQGAYLISTRSNDDGIAEIKVEFEGPGVNKGGRDICESGGSKVDGEDGITIFNEGIYTYKANDSGGVTLEGPPGVNKYSANGITAERYLLYSREKTGNGKPWYTKIYIWAGPGGPDGRTCGDGMVCIDGEKFGVPIYDPNNFNGGNLCWDCGSGDPNAWCANLDIDISMTANVEVCSVCTGSTCSVARESSCADGNDNDGDGETDCDDSDCGSNDACTAACASETCCSYGERCDPANGNDDCCSILVCSSGGSCLTSMGAGGSGCFVAGTPVATPEGIIPIEDVTVGTEIRAYDLTTSEHISSIVNDVEVKDVTTLVHVTLADGTLITTTPVHRFWTKRGWVAVGDFIATDELFTKEGIWTTFTFEEESLDEPVTVYNLHIEDDAHNFFAGGVLVHNLKESDPK